MTTSRRLAFSASNVVLVQGSTGWAIVDTSANPADAGDIIEGFGDRFKRTVVAVLYNHNHPDHTGGAIVFAASDRPRIYGHRTLVEGKPELGRGQRDGGDAFGTKLPDELFTNAGTQLEYGRRTPHTREGFLPPTDLVNFDNPSIEAAGHEIELIHAPGEAPENLAIWLPHKGVLMPGDIFLKTFPNLSPHQGPEAPPA